MKVLPHVVHVFTVAQSLAFVRGQAAFLRPHGYELTVVSSPDPALDTFGKDEGVPVFGVSMPRRISPSEDAASLLRLVALFRRLRPDIVHSHTPKGGLLGTIAAKLAGVPVRIYHMRGLPLMTAQGVQRAILTGTERTSCALSTQVISVSSSLRDVAIDRHLCAPDKIRVLASGSGNGVDCDRFDATRVGAHARNEARKRLGIPDDAPVIGFVGRLVRDKGVAELVDAFAVIKKLRPETHLLLAGSFEERDPVPVSTRSALTADPHVHLLGYVHDTPAFYATIDVLALPTYREGFPNVPLEAAAMGVPVVTTRVPGCVDAVVDGVSGVLVPPRDSDALAKALEVYLGSRSLREAHGIAARARVEKSYRRERIWEELVAVYDGLLGRVRSRS